MTERYIDREKLLRPPFPDRLAVGEGRTKAAEVADAVASSQRSADTGSAVATLSR